MDRKLGGGTIIQERKVATELGISRTPMRMALARLEGEAFLTRLSERLLAVRTVSLPECLDAIGIRKLIEPEATRLATPRIELSVLEDLKGQLSKLMTRKKADLRMEWEFDDRLHQTIAKYSGNLAMVDTVARLRRTTRLFVHLKVAEPSSLSHGGNEHLKIIEAMASRDAEEAARAMYVHLDNSCEGILNKLH